MQLYNRWKSLVCAVCIIQYVHWLSQLLFEKANLINKLGKLFWTLDTKTIVKQY